PDTVAIERRRPATTETARMTTISIDTRTSLRFMVPSEFWPNPAVPIRLARCPPVAGASTRFDGTGDDIAGNAPRILGISGGKRDFIAAHLSIGDARGAAANLKRTGELLETLR